MLTESTVPERPPGSANASLPVIQTVQETKPFMQRFDPTLVGKPGPPPPHHVPGRDPVWAQICNTHQLIDPATANRPEQCIAFWSFVADCPHFLDNGYLKIDPNDPSKWKFTFRPDEEAFPQEKSKISLTHFLLHYDILKYI